MRRPGCDKTNFRSIKKF
uniref:Uncharacterized protein n=1 Tax=Romanomermis culicivorax TaxID=13658 RepID=A0A915K7Q0_ROMCU